MSDDFEMEVVETGETDVLRSGDTPSNEKSVSDSTENENVSSALIGEIPNDWKIRRVEDVSGINPDGFSPDDHDGSSFEYISLSDTEEGKVLGSSTIPTDEAPSRAQRQVREGDVLVGTVRPKQASHGFVTAEHDKNICSSGFGVLRAGEKLNSQYLRQEVLSHRFFRQMMGYVAGSGYPAVKLSDLTKHRVVVPPLPEQRKIASVLYTVDQAIQKTEDIIEQAKRVKRGLMQDLLQRSRSSSEEGNWQQLGEVTEWISGSTPSKGNDAYWGGTIPWVSAKDMKEVRLDGAEDHLTSKGVDEFGMLAPKGSLLVLVRGMRLKDSIPVCLVREEVAFNQDVKALIPKKGVEGEFLAYWMKSNENRILGLVTSASHGTKRLGTDSLKNFRVWIPSEEYQQEMVQVFRAFDQKIRGGRVHRNRLSQLKKGLMQDLLTGEVRTADTAIEVLGEVAAYG